MLINLDIFIPVVPILSAYILKYHWNWTQYKVTQSDTKLHSPIQSYNSKLQNN